VASGSRSVGYLPTAWRVHATSSSSAGSGPKMPGWIARRGLAELAPQLTIYLRQSRLALQF